MRLFVGLFPPAAALADLRRALPAEARLTPIDRWHITMVFLGEVPDDRLPGVTAALARVSCPRGIRLSLAGGGGFENAGVLWAAVHGDLAELTKLQQNLHTSLADAGFAGDSRPYRPHLTVAYRESEGVRAALTAYAGPAWSVDEFVLVRSYHEEGGGYDQLNSWPC